MQTSLSSDSMRFELECLQLPRHRALAETGFCGERAGLGECRRRQASLSAIPALGSGIE